MSGTVGSDPQISWQVSPTGGLVTLKLASTAAGATWTLTRYVVVNGVKTSPYVLFTGTQETVFVDINDGGLAPLDPSKTYEYVFETLAGSADTGPVTVGATITLLPDNLTPILFRALQAGVAALTLPGSGAFNNRPRVIQAMPLAGDPTLPLISLNCTLLQQEEIPIGQNTGLNDQNNTYLVTGQATRHYDIAILTMTVEEREFYRDAVLGIFNACLGPILDAIGQNSRHRFQVSQSQVTRAELSPGFYFAELLLEIKGTFNVAITTGFGLIEYIDGADGQGDLFEIPFAG